MRRLARFTRVRQLTIGRRHHDLLLVLASRIGTGQRCQKSAAVHGVLSFVTFDRAVPEVWTALR
jgi:hypothetical protein